MNNHYTTERNVQILISVLKANNISKVIASPGTTNICFVASLQQDPFFTVYSAPDERSAGYMACGLSIESGEPVVISCTGATASRNYMPALTEAFYRKIPILAVTSSRRSSNIGHNFDQVTDRSQLPKDVVKMSVQLPVVLDNNNEWANVIAANKAIQELKHRGFGPVHINLETEYSRIYDVKSLPETRIIKRYLNSDSLPLLESKRTAIFVGSHKKWSQELTHAVDEFCKKYNGVVLCDALSNYKGLFRAFANLNGAQRDYQSVVTKADVMIHIGDVAASSYSIACREVWRVNPDGEFRDTFHRLTNVFEMEELEFFERYNKFVANEKRNSFWEAYEKESLELRKELEASVISKLPFSNAWIASQTACDLPENSVLHLGIQNSLRFWNFFETSSTVLGYCNTGGFGIDGSLSTIIGAALCNPDKLYFMVLGDLAFFYDFNSLGNRHVGKNIRILLVNNGKGTEFKLTGNPGAMFGDDADQFIAAAGHYGNKSKDLVRHYAEDLGFKYLTASSKDEYLIVKDKFLDKNLSSSVILEVFTESYDEDNALTSLKTILTTPLKTAIRETKDFTRGIIGEKGTQIISNLLGK